jgi:hypothetical protein
MSMSAMGWLQSSLGLDITGEWNRIVHLNVGGLLYMCQRKTFKDRTSTLAKMVVTDAFPRAEDGSMVIDRDGNSFRHVLNFLRTGRLLVADGFDEWDLLLDDAAAYGMRDLEDAISGHPAYQRRQFRRALPQSVYLRFDYTVTSPVATPAPAASSPVGGSAGEQQSSKSVAAVHLLPPLPMLSVNPDTRSLQHHGRDVSSVDEAVTILMTTYEMTVNSWERTPVSSTVFLTIRPVS